MPTQKQPNSVSLSATATIPELQQSKTAVLNTLASQHSRRSYEYAIERLVNAASKNIYVVGEMASDVPKVGRCKSLSAKPEHDSSAEPEIVLAVIQPVRDFCKEVVGLHGANGDVLGHFEINAAACRHRKIVFGPSLLRDAVGCADASEENLSERRNFAAPEIHSRPKEIGEPCSCECSVPAAGRNKAAQVSYRTEPAVDVVLDLATPTVTVVGCRGCNARGIGIYIKARVVVPHICLKIRGCSCAQSGPALTAANNNTIAREFLI
jgi:hypothetical protein